MTRHVVFLALLLPVALQAQQLPGPSFRPADGRQRAERVLDNVQRLDASLSGVRRVFVDPVTGTLQWLEMEPGAVSRSLAMPTADAAASRFVAAYGVQLFGTAFTPADLQLRTTYSDGLLTHFRYGQRFNGFPVYGGDLLVHVAHVGGRYAVQSVNGRMYPGIDAPARPALSFDAARQAAIGRARSTFAIEEQDPTPLVVPDGDHFRLAYTVIVSDPSAGTVIRYVDAVSGEVFAETPGVISATSRSEGPGSDVAPSPPIDVGASEGMGWVSTSGTDALNQNRTFNVWQASGSVYQLASNGWPGITQVEIRNFLGEDILFAGACGGDRPYVQTSSIAGGWPSTTDAGKEEVSAVANMGASHTYMFNKFGRYSIGDDRDFWGRPTRAARACIHGVARDLEGNPTFNAVFYQGNWTWGFVRGETAFKPSAAPQDVVTHEVWHGVSEDEVNFIFEFEPNAMNEALSDYFGARHRGSACLGFEGVGFCFRNLNNTATVTDLRDNICETGDFHCVSVAFSSAVWATANKSFGSYGDPTDWAVYNGQRYYMTSATGFTLARESTIRAGKDRLRNGTSFTDITVEAETEFYNRGIGPEAIRLRLPQYICNEWWPDIMGSGSRSFAVWFEAGSGFFNDGSVDHRFYNISLGTFTDATLPMFPASQVGGHQANDGHDHAFRFRFTDVGASVGYIDYFVDATRQCGISPVAAQQPTGGAVAPQTFAVRQALQSNGALVSSRLAATSAVGEGSEGAITGLSEQVRNSGISALEIDIPSDRAGQRLEITVFDLQGRPVRTMTEDGVVAGRKSVIWDRMTATGASAPAGVYVVVVRYGGAVQRTRFVIPRSR